MRFCGRLNRKREHFQLLVAILCEWMCLLSELSFSFWLRSYWISLNRGMTRVFTRDGKHGFYAISICLLVLIVYLFDFFVITHS